MDSSNRNRVGNAVSSYLYSAVFKYAEGMEIFAVLNAVAQILHAVLPSVSGNSTTITETKTVTQPVITTNSESK